MTADVVVGYNALLRYLATRPPGDPEEWAASCVADAYTYGLRRRPWSEEVNPALLGGPMTDAEVVGYRLVLRTILDAPRPETLDAVSNWIVQAVRTAYLFGVNMQQTTIQN